MPRRTIIRSEGRSREASQIVVRMENTRNDSRIACDRSQPPACPAAMKNDPAKRITATFRILPGSERFQTHGISPRKKVVRMTAVEGYTSTGRQAARRAPATTHHIGSTA